MTKDKGTKSQHVSLPVLQGDLDKNIDKGKKIGEISEKGSSNGTMGSCIKIIDGDIEEEAWDPNATFTKEDIRMVPIWIQVQNLDFKYRGQRSLLKIVGHIGKPIKEDQATRNRDLLQYARILVEVSISQVLPQQIVFENEKGDMVYLGIHYEWKPIVCTHCNGIGHHSKGCKRKQNSGKMWVPKKTNLQGEVVGDVMPAPKVQKPRIDEDGFQEVKTTAKRSPVVPIDMDNMFCVLDENVEELRIGQVLSKVKAKNLGSLYIQHFAGWCFTTNLAYHPGGRIVLPWNPIMFDLDIERCSSQMIHYLVTPKHGAGFEVTFVYAFNESGGREFLWQDLKDLSVTMDGPWVMLGDFNAVLFPEERIHLHGRPNDCRVMEDCMD
ncbi:uncharacterized protein LOC133814426 [Humulus lupulus]|uniref:uncharacterized protein LOC133814426 n=1 Tax=Humulus lupulus TaxID=3486 RepID=UPI002B403112|nr:uncharacterized protein LOC133814426 [Humulus lupulus]